MNTPSPLNPGTPALKIQHREPLESADPANQTAAQRELAADMEALREREANLREYEARLRAWQAQLDSRTAQPKAGSDAPFVNSLSQMPFSSDSLLASSWEKFHRARAILESEQKQLRDERMTMRDMDLHLKKREAELAAREEALSRREAGTNPPIPPEKKKTESTMERLTKAPFLAARSVFKSDK
jgi:negative regulator of sigma E activity